MTIKIDKPITAFAVKKEGDVPVEKEPVVIERVPKVLDRPYRLDGSTYKLDTQLSDNALYITINNIVLNPGTEEERTQPFEIFLNSKDMSHFQWVVALTRIISALFRKGGEVAFIIEELRSVVDPNGGYFKKGTFVPSLVAEIGIVVEDHFKRIGLIESEELDEATQEFLQKKAEDYLKANPDVKQDDDTGYPANALLCDKCKVKALVKQEGCLTCLSCGESKCA